MGLFARLGSPTKGFFLLRRLLAEQRAQTRALERLADATELLALGASGGAQESTNAQVFRSYSRTKDKLSEGDLKAQTEVAYVDEAALAGMLRAEEELRIILGRDPTEEEIMAGYRGEILS